MVMLMAQVFVALLRTCQPDGRRVLVRQALDTLTPALVRRLAPGDAKYPIWVRYTKKVLVEEGHSIPTSFTSGSSSCATSTSSIPPGDTPRPSLTSLRGRVVTHAIMLARTIMPLT